MSSLRPESSPTPYPSPSSAWTLRPVISRASRPLAVSALAAMLAACASAPPPKPPPPMHRFRDARVNLAPVSGTLVSGRIEISAIGEGVHLGGEIGGLGRDAAYTLRVHERGDCRAADGSSAGAPFQPATTLGDVRADARGVARIDVRIQGVTLGSGAFNDILGRALVMHDGAGDPLRTGRSELRIACGVIDVRF